MVGSRHLQGTIISRVKYLLDSGSLKKAPIWFDVVKRFPPPKHSLLSFADTVEVTEVPKITYPEDDIKRKFHQNFDRAIRDPDSLFKDIKVEETKTQLFMKSYTELIDDGKNEEEAMTEALEKFQLHLDSIREQKQEKQEAAALNQQVEAAANQTDSKSSDLSLNEFFDIFKQK